MEHPPKELTAAIEGLYFPDPPQQLVDNFGGTLEDYRPEVELSADIVDSFYFYQRIDTQWRTGPGGLIGLDYTVIPIVAKIYNVEVSAELMDDIATMEAAAIKTIMGNVKT
ncbi:hypothetical protein [Klebsiella phage phiKp_14]|nr:MAG: protein of unknown function (DUF1799) [Bacteriophage sp.]BEH86271.1 hypothetical protein [Klebsiella phage phiKp_14]CAK6604538.1 tail length tape measure protein [Klebsiella phage vB_Kpn_K34PH164]